MLKQDTYLINIARAPFKFSNLKQPIYYKLRPEIIKNYASFIAHHDKPNYKLLQDYYKLRQLLFLKNLKLLQITSSFATYYGSFQYYYKLQQFLLQITAGATNYDVIANYVVTKDTRNSEKGCFLFEKRYFLYLVITFIS